MKDEYPKAMYRDGGTEQIWGKCVQTQLVMSVENENAASAEGWRLHPITDEQERERRKPGRPRKVEP